LCINETCSRGALSVIPLSVTANCSAAGFINAQCEGTLTANGKEAVERAAALCKEAGAKRALPLAVSVPSHCALMKPAAEQLALTLEGITLNAPATPVLNNVDVKAETESAEIRTALIRQLYSIRFVKPFNTLPGPISTKTSTPSCAIFSTVSVQRTGLYN